ADVRASCARPRGGRLPAAGPRDLVPERREAVGIGPMPKLIDMIDGKRIDGHHPCPRLVVNEDGWRLAADQMTAGRWTLLGLWGDAGAAHMAVLGPAPSEVAVITIECPDGRFPSL